MKFRSKSQSAPQGFQLAPMIDVVFLLLCFFVTTQIFSQWETEIDVTLPTAESGEIPGRLPGEIILNIRADGSLVVNRQTLSATELTDLLQQIVGLFPGQPVVIRADRDTAYEHVIRVLDICRRIDVWNVSFATTEAIAD